MTDLNMGDTLWAWVTQTPDGAISLIGVAMPGLGHTPLIGRDRSTVQQMGRLAVAHGAALKQKVWLRRYVLQEEIGREVN
jgi:hypothetical protein